MSDVRLSSGSPTLERGEPRVPQHPKPSACRSLFGSVDHDELRRDLKGHLWDLEQAAAAKWGFDFAAHSPLDNGGIRWEPVDYRDVPDFYTRPPRTSNRVDLNGNHSCVAGATTAIAGGPTECSEQCTAVRKRPACHETSTPSKRSHSSPGEVAFPSRSRSAEHTPRKRSGSPGRQT
ncbi:cyclin-dependent kinase inhibitor 1Bb [Dunckerocampus dactyliophorus]|uniref:cyclin-dependent kinase inhibitor 1Bb n=1 Tax=Dunckerocampus dactyliophorus TaxID=161453 RepID=UPI002404C0CA|nr:cyclin-dependent kinase inhibitor 1Bb [Dunckerocampus dactyliophorus]